MHQDLASQRPLKAIVRDFRTAKGLTRRQFSEKCGIPYSSFLKVEKGELFLTHEQIRQICRRFDTRIENFLDDRKHHILCRRSIGRIELAPKAINDQGVSHHLCADLLNKRMTPILRTGFSARLQAESDFTRYAGDAFIYIVRGSLAVHTEFYSAVELTAGQSIYLGPRMAHALVGAEGATYIAALCILSDPRDLHADLSPAVSYGARRPTLAPNTANNVSKRFADISEPAASPT